VPLKVVGSLFFAVEFQSSTGISFTEMQLACLTPPSDIIGFLRPNYTIFIIITTLFSNKFVNPENFIEANRLLRPPHIQLQWYFLWLYCVCVLAEVSRGLPSESHHIHLFAAAAAASTCCNCDYCNSALNVVKFVLWVLIWCRCETTCDTALASIQGAVPHCSGGRWYIKKEWG